MRTVTHREMLNQSGEILRDGANGETVRVTNNGQLVALIVPPNTETFEDLVSRGQVRTALRPPSSLLAIRRSRGRTDSKTIVADSR